jgi:hypothetical protein
MDSHQTYATPSGRDVHLDVPLSNLAVSAFDTGDESFIAEQILPAVPVGKQSDKYYTISKEAFLRVPDTKRAPRTEARRVEFEVSSDAYFANNYALAAENALEDLANADLAIQLRQNSTRLVVTNLRRDMEVRTAGLITSISNVGSGVQLTGTSKWGDSNSDPVADVTTGHAFIRHTTGLKANTMIVDEDTIAIVRRHPLLLDMFKYTSGGEVTDDQLRSVFKVNRMLIGSGIKENALEGGVSSITNIWGNNAVLVHLGPATGLQSQTFGLRFRWQPPIFPANMGVFTRVENGAGTKKIELVEAGYYQDERIVASDLAYVIQDTL